MKKLLMMGLIAAAAQMLMSCASMSSMQTARTTAKGEFGGSGGIGVVNSEIQIAGDTIKTTAPFLEGSCRYGLKDNWDVGFKLTIIGTAMADTKYQFLGNDTSLFAGSGGVGLGYMKIGIGTTDIYTVDAHVPLYFSIHPTKWFGFYVNPRYVLRMTSYQGDSGSASTTGHWYGATSGIRLGKETAFLAEYSYYGNSNYPAPFSQFTCGVAVGIR